MFGFHSKTSFNGAPVKRAAQDGSRRALYRFGGYVRKVAMGSIVEAEGPAAAGQPPHAHVGAARRAVNRARKAAGKAAKKAKGFFKGLKFILFSVDRARGNVVIGPASNRTRSVTIAEILEEGLLGVEERPYMGPAFIAGKRRLPDFWAGSVKK